MDNKSTIPAPEPANEVQLALILESINKSIATSEKTASAVVDIGKVIAEKQKDLVQPVQIEKVVTVKDRPPRKWDAHVTRGIDGLINQIDLTAKDGEYPDKWKCTVGRDDEGSIDKVSIVPGENTHRVN
jgi:hypothetical protein